MTKAKSNDMSLFGIEGLTDIYSRGQCRPKKWTQKIVSFYGRLVGSICPPDSLNIQCNHDSPPNKLWGGIVYFKGSYCSLYEAIIPNISKNIVTKATFMVFMRFFDFFDEIFNIFSFFLASSDFLQADLNLLKVNRR